MTFKVETKRGDKRFPKDSTTISREMGHLILKEFPFLKVDVKDPQLRVTITIGEQAIYVSTSSKKILGIGGQPWGMSGHCVTLISGGFDSPVASYLMAKRGCQQTYIFFYAYPFVGEEVLDKIFDLTKILGPYQRAIKLFVIPFGDFQNLVTQKCKPEYRTLMFRRYMIECAHLLAHELGADALVTGDSLGQVSSQTIHNMAILDGLSHHHPIFRPLIGLNKSEIIQIAREIGTYPVSARPHDDACSLFAPRHPILRPNPTYWERYNREVQLSQDLEECLKQAHVYTLTPAKDELVKELYPFGRKVYHYKTQRDF